LFYAEGNWNHHLAAFAELPERSIVFHIDQGDAAEAHRALGDKFCLSGGIPNLLLSRGSPEQVHQHCAHILRTIGRDGGYILDASAIIQNDARVENLRAMTDAVGQYGVYDRGHSKALTEPVKPRKALAEPVARPKTLAEPVAPPKALAQPVAPPQALAEPVARPKTLAEPVARPKKLAEPMARPVPGTCVPWSQVRANFADIPGDQAICHEVWDRIDAMANMFIWTLFLVF
jgi:hypothetical protein